MSHSQFHCTGRVYLDMHGLIFETSICYWQDQPGSRTTFMCDRQTTYRRQRQAHSVPSVAGQARLAVHVGSGPGMRFRYPPFARHSRRRHTAQTQPASRKENAQRLARLAVHLYQFETKEMCPRSPFPHES